MATGWQFWFGTFTGVILGTVVLLPVAALAVWALARRRAGALLMEDAAHSIGGTWHDPAGRGGWGADRVAGRRASPGPAPG